MSKLLILLIGASMFLFVLLAQLAFYVAVFWFCASTLTSTVKAVTNDCNETYIVEKVVSGSWFCPVDSKGDK